ncbi:MAG: hypothetical protein ACQEV7_04615 [Bacillota bacterium]
MIQYDIQKLVSDRQAPMKALQAGFEEIRVAEAEKRAKAEAEEMALLPPRELTPEEQIQLLTKAVDELTIKLDGKGKGE